MSKENNGKRPLTRAEKFKNYCIGLGAMTALILGAWANLKGEPEAKRAHQKSDEVWSTLKVKVDKQSKALNEQSTAIEKIARRMIFLQAHQEGFSAGKLHVELEQARVEIAKLKNRGRRPNISEDLAAVKAKLTSEIKRRKLAEKRKAVMMHQQKTLPRMKPLPASPKKAH